MKATETTEVLIAGIKLINRVRVDLGDLDPLAESIMERGLLNPITIDKDHVLICGHRRVEAMKLLGAETIDARIVGTAAETIDALMMERDENELRKEFTPSEKIAMTKLIEGKERAEAKARKVAAGKLYGRGKPIAPVQADGSYQGESRDRIAAAVGMSAGTMIRAAKVVNNGAPELVAAMDSGDLSVNCASHLADLPKEEQVKALSKGKKAALSAAKELTPKRKKKEAPKTQEIPEAVAVPVERAPQMSALVMKVRIMMAMDYLTASDPDSIRVLTEVMTRCKALIEKFTTEA